MEYEDKQDFLLEVLNDLYKKGLYLRLRDQDPKGVDIPLTVIDPFSFMGALNRRMSDDKRIKIAEIFKKVFNLSSNIPEDFDGVPYLVRNSWFSPYKHHRDKDHVSTLWELFRNLYQAKKLDDVNEKLFNKSLNLRQVGKANLTMGLFWINPEVFLPIDANIKNYLQVKTFNDFKDYKVILEKIKEEYPNKRFYELSHEAWVRGKEGNEQEGDLQYMENQISERKELRYSVIPLNRIFYGPPGTGKTYRTIEETVKICNPEFYSQNKGSREKIKEEYNRLANEGRIAFVTFHQSYSYEEFVEGIKPDFDAGELKYKLSDGIFKRICKLAENRVNIDFTNVKFYKMSIAPVGEPEMAYYCLENNIIALGFGDDVDFSDVETKEDIKDIVKDMKFSDATSEVIMAVNIFVRKMKKGDIVIVPYGNQKIIGIAQIMGDYYLDTSLPIRHHQVRDVRYLWKVDNIEDGIDAKELIKKNIVTRTLYKFREGVVNIEKLRELIGNKTVSYENVDEILEKMQEYVEKEIEEKGYFSIGPNNATRIYEKWEDKEYEGFLFSTKHGEGEKWIFVAI